METVNEQSQENSSPFMETVNEQSQENSSPFMETVIAQPFPFMETAQAEIEADNAKIT